MGTLAAPAGEREAVLAAALLPEQALYLEAFREHGLATAAAESVGVTQRTVRRWQQEPAFAEALAEAEEVYRDVHRREIHRRAIDGVEEPVYQGGRHVGTVRKYSDALLMFMAKARLPEFRDKGDAAVNVQTQVVVAWREKQVPGAGATVDAVVSGGSDPPKPG